MGALTAILCDAAGNPLAVDGPLLGVTSAQVTLEQLDLFEGHQITISGDFRRNLAAIAPWTTVKISEAGVGVVGWGVITNPATQITDAGNKIVLTLPNITEQLRLSDTGQGWVASTGIGTIVNRLGALRPGWSARFVDTGPNIVTSAPVQWTATNATATANTLTKTGGVHAQWDAGGISQQAAAGGNCATTFVVLSTATDTLCGLTAAPGMPTFASVDFGFWVHNGALFTAEGGVVFGPVATAAVGDILRVGVEGAAVKYYKNNLLVRTSAAAPRFPLWVAGVIWSANAQLGGVTFTRLTPPAEAWFAIRFEQATLLGALTDLAKQTFHHVRLAKRTQDGSDATGPFLAGDPRRVIDVGTFGAASTLRLISAQGGSVSAINANPDVRIITAFSRSRDASNVINSIAPLGGGTDTPVTLERCWRIVNDPTYPGFGKYGQVDGSIFPEYDAAYPLPSVLLQGTPVPARLNRAGTAMEPAVTLDGKFEYRVTDPASIAYWKAIFDPTGTAGETGEMRGTLTDSALTYPDQTPGNQEVTARTLYVEAITKLRYSALTNETIALTTTGAGRVPHAGDLVRVAYTRTGTDKDGTYTQVAIDADYTVLGVKRTYDDNGPVKDDWLLSDKGQRPQSNQSAAADARATMKALQLVPTTGLALLPVTGGGDCDVTHPYDKVVPLPAELFRVRSAPLHVEFKPVRHNVSVTDSVDHVHSYTVPSLNVNIPALTVTLPALTVTLPPLAVVLPAQAVTIPVQSVVLPSIPVALPNINVALPSIQVPLPALPVRNNGFQFSLPYGGGTDLSHGHGNSGNGLAHGHAFSFGTHSHKVGGGAVGGTTDVFVDPNTPTPTKTTAVGSNVSSFTARGQWNLPVSAQDVTVSPSVTDQNALGVPGFGGFGTNLSTVPTTVSTTDSATSNTYGRTLASNDPGGVVGTTFSTAQIPSLVGSVAQQTIGGPASPSFGVPPTTIGGSSDPTHGVPSGTFGGPGTGLGVGSQFSTAGNDMVIGGDGSHGVNGGRPYVIASGTTAIGDNTPTPGGSTTTYPNAQILTGSGGRHSHVLQPGIFDTSTSMRVQLWIDSGDEQFVDRSPALGGPWVSSFDVPDLSPYVQAPGRKVRIRIQPQSLAGQLDGLGSVEIFGTWVVELGGVSSVVYAA